MKRLLAAALLLAGCSHRPPLTAKPAASPEIRMLEVGRSTHAYLVMGEKPILVDTGWGNSTKTIEKELAANGIKPSDLALIVLTHGHGDHAGGAKHLRELSGAKVVAGAGDVAMLAAGHNRIMKRTDIMGVFIKPIADRPFPPFAPDIALEGRLDLKPYGIDGEVVSMPGHTPGSLVVILADGDAIVGDMVRGSVIDPSWPRHHYFQEECRTEEGHIDDLIAAGIRTLYVGHGGPLSAADTAVWLSEHPCRK